MLFTLPDHTADKHLFLGTGAKPRTIHGKPNERRPSTTMDDFSSAKQTEFPLTLVNFFSTRLEFFFGLDSNFKISTQISKFRIVFVVATVAWYFFVREHIFCKSRLMFFIAFAVFYKFRLLKAK